MQAKRVLAASAFALAGIAGSAHAAPCAGFTDVDDQDPVCRNVEWIKNRAITTGCGGTLYCPNDFVTRLQMAAFMNRVGTALSSVFLRKRDPNLGGQDFSTVKTLCPTDPVSLTAPPAGIGNFNRTAIVTGLLNAFTVVDGTGMDLKATLVYSTDGGANWIVPATNDGTAYGSLYRDLVPPDDISLRPMNFIELAPGLTYQFAIQGIRIAGAAQVANAYCEMHVQIVNRNGTSSPFDPPADPGPHGRGF